MKYPKISIVTPNFNGEAFLEETIESVLSQNYPNLEYIIIDGNSTDRSVDIIKKYEKHLSYWISEKDQGQADAINKGMKKCTGDIFNWINSDDCYRNNCLLSVGNYFSMHKDLNVLIGCENYNQNGKIISQNKTFIASSIEETLGNCRIGQPSTFFNLNTVRSIGYLRTDLYYFFDLEWWVRYLTHFGLKNIMETEDIFIDFRIHENAKTADAIKYYKERIFILYTILTTQGVKVSSNVAEYLEFTFTKNSDISDNWKKINKISSQKLSLFCHFGLLNNFITDNQIDHSKIIAKYLLKTPIIHPKKIAKCIHTLLIR